MPEDDFQPSTSTSTSTPKDSAPRPATATPSTGAPHTLPKPRKKRRPLIDYGRMTDRKRAKVTRILEAGAKLGVDEEARCEKARLAVASALHKFLEIEDTDETFVEDVFERLLDVARGSPHRRSRPVPGASRREVGRIRRFISGPTGPRPLFPCADHAHQPGRYAVSDNGQVRPRTPKVLSERSGWKR